MDGGTAWVWPHWLERQLDPTSPAFVPRGQLSYRENVTDRGWTSIGNVGSNTKAVVDGSGLVTPWPHGWSLDWWVGAEDRWHLPSRERGVRQKLVADAPVVETAMRVPGGDVVHRAYAVRTAPADGARELVVVEVENATPVPVALAVSVRPWNVEGVAPVERIALHHGGAGGSGVANAVVVDGRVAVLLPRPPNRSAGSTAADGDVAAVVLGGGAGTGFPDDLRCRDGLASAAFVYPLPHRASVRFLLLMVDALQPRRRPFLVRRSRRPVAPPSLPATVPTPSQVANGWKSHSARGMQVVLPDSRLASAVEANRRFLLLAGGDGGDGGDGALGSVAGALDRYGYHAEATEVLTGLLEHQRRDGSFPARLGEGEATGAVLHAIGEHRRLQRDLSALDDLAPSVAAAAEWLERRWRDRGSPSSTEGRLWAARGMADAAEVLSALGEADAGAQAGERAARMSADLDAGADADGAVESVAGSLAGCWPLRLWGAGHPRVAAAAGAVKERSCVGAAVFDGVSRTGLRPDLTIVLALVELEAGDRSALDRLDWLLSVASPTWTWPEAVHPRLATGCGGDGHDIGVAADALSFVRNLLVRETLEGGLALCSLVPAGWLGQPLEVHDAPTHHGSLSFALRWHGDRPALLWELVPHDEASVVLITVPGLDRSWSTTELRGDALLAPVAPPEPEPSEPVPLLEPDAPVTPVRLTRRPRP